MGVDHDIELALDACNPERLDRLRLPDIARKIIVDLPVVHRQLSASGPEQHPRHRILAPPGTPIVDHGILHRLSSLPVETVDGLGTLRSVWMASSGVDLEFFVHGTSQFCLGQHAPHDLFDETLRMLFQNLEAFFILFETFSIA